MRSRQSAVRQAHDPHVHPLNETCPVCDQPITNEKALQVRARIDAREHALLEAATTSAAQQVATERTRIEAEANASIEKVRAESSAALHKASGESAAKADAARLEGRLQAESALAERLAAAEKARADAETSADARIAAAEQSAKAHETTWQSRIAAADAEKQEALAQVQVLKTDQEVLVAERIREAREALEQDKADVLAAAKAEHDTETRKLSSKLETLQRQINKQRADDLGEGAEVKLFDALKAEFPDDDIRRVSKGVSGADILHTVIQNGRKCGTIIYDSKNSTAWRDDYVTKLIRDQTAAKAEQAILSTFQFPAGACQVEVRESVIVVNPARAIAVVGIVRKQMVLVHTLRLSKNERTKKMAELYDFITSERCGLLLGRIDSEAESLMKMQDREVKAHKDHWEKQGRLLRSIQKVKAELETEIDLIVSGCGPTDEDDDDQT